MVSLLRAQPAKTKPPPLYEMTQNEEVFIPKKPFLSFLGEGLALIGIVLLLIGLMGTARLFREEYVGPVPAVVKGFVPIAVSASAEGSAPPLVGLRAPLASPMENEERASVPVTAAGVQRAAGTQRAAEPEPAAENAPPVEPEPAAESLAVPEAPRFSAYLPSVVRGMDEATAPAPAEGQAGEVQPAADASQPPAEAQVTEPALPAIPDRIEIPVIGLDAPVVAVPAVEVRISGQLLQQWSAPNSFAAGFHVSSAQLGQPGNTVLNGHHNIYGSVFGRLRDMNPGEQILVWSQGRAFFYEVEQILLLEERFAELSDRHENARWILPSDDERLTLVTCWPPESNTHRLIVVARPVHQ